MAFLSDNFVKIIFHDEDAWCEFFLQTIEIQENKIDRIDGSTFRGFVSVKALEDLNLASNHLKELPDKSFQSFRNLSALVLSQNQIYYIHPDAFAGIEGKLRLEWRAFQSISRDASQADWNSSSQLDRN